MADDERGSVPTLPPTQLDRAVLLDRLDGITRRPLTLVTGPLGSGKTSLVARWCRERYEGPVNWIDASEGSVAELAAEAGGRGGVVVVDGVRSAADAVAVAELSRRRSAGAAPTSFVLLTRLRLTAELAAWRLDHRFDELGDGDLRLTPTEFATLVERHTGDRVAYPVAAAVTQQTEGWLAAAVLIAITWERGTDPSNHRNQLRRGYEAAEALAVTATLDGAADHVGEALQAGSPLPELQGDLLDGLTGRTDGRATLRTLERSGALLARRSSHPDLVRLHPLARAGFADAASLDEGQRRSALEAGVSWFSGHHHPILAAVCLGELGQWEAAGEVALDHLQDLERQGRILELAAALGDFPISLVQHNFRLVYLATWMLYTRSDIGGGLALLAAVEPELRPEQRMMVEFMRSLTAALVEDPRPSLEAAERALALCDQLPEDTRFEDLIGATRVEHWRALCRGIGLLAGTYLGAWDRTAAFDLPLDPAVAIDLRPGSASATRARRAIHAAYSGRLSVAEQEWTALRAALPAGDVHADQQSVQGYVAMAEVHRLRGAWDRVPSLLDDAEDRSVVTPVSNVQHSVAAARAQLHLDLHRPELASDVLERARLSAVHGPPAHVAGLLAAAEGLARCACGDAPGAWRGLIAATRTSAVANALVLVALHRGDLPAAAGVLETWPEDPTLRAQLGQLLARAAIAERRGDRRDSLTHLRHALAVAAPEGLLQPVLEYGVHLLGPLWHLAQNAVEPGVASLAQAAADRLRATGSAHPPLTARERVVLHHLATGAPLPTIARQLTVSINTVKSQVRSIYKKLDAPNRDAAVAIWRDLQDGSGADEPGPGRRS